MPSLTTASDVETYLGNSYDPAMGSLIALLIPRVSADFERETDRTFEDTAYFEWLDGTGDCYIRLKQYPIVALRRVTVGTQGVGYLTNATTNCTHATATVSSTELKLSRVVSGVAGTDSITLATYATMALLAAAVAALSKDWTLTITSGFTLYPPVQIRPGFIGDCLSPRQGYLDVAYGVSYECDVDSVDASILCSPYGFPKGHQNIFVDYTAGYETIPADLTDLITCMVAWATLQAGSDFTMKREKLDNYEYERAVEDQATSALEQFADGVSKWKKRSYP